MTRGQELEPLILDLLEWVGPDGRHYEEVMEAWRTSCPRLPVWEEATARGLLERARREGLAVVLRTRRGTAFLEGHGRRARS